MHTVEITDLSSKDCFGEYDAASSTIRIEKSLNQQQQEATFFHELFHAFNACLDDGNHGIFHALMESLSLQLYQVLHDNNLLTK